MGVRVLRLNGTHMNVSWNQIPLSEVRGFIITYRVLYHKTSIDRRRRQVVVILVPGSETNTLIGGLNPPSSYQVYVKAATLAGEGEYSSIPVVAKSKFTTTAMSFTIYVLSETFIPIHLSLVVASLLIAKRLQPVRCVRV